MIRKYVEKILERDGKLTPFVYIESERKINGLISLSDHSEIRLKGFIDRVDEVRDAIRIIDYKSGSGTTTFSSIESLFNKEEKDRAKAVMQVFMYCWMYAHLTENKGKTIQPGIYYVRSLFADPFDHLSTPYRTGEVGEGRGFLRLCPSVRGGVARLLGRDLQSRNSLYANP